MDTTSHIEHVGEAEVRGIARAKNTWAGREFAASLEANPAFAVFHM